MWMMIMGGPLFIWRFAPQKSNLKNKKCWIEKVSGDWTAKTTTLLKRPFYINALRPDLCLWALQILQQRGTNPPRGRLWMTIGSHDCPPTAFPPPSHRQRARPAAIYQPWLKNKQGGTREKKEQQDSPRVRGLCLPMLQLLKKLSQCLAALQRLMQHKSNKLHNNLKIIYVIL